LTEHLNAQLKARIIFIRLSNLRQLIITYLGTQSVTLDSFEEEPKRDNFFFPDPSSDKA
jgi:hypothetical protein